MGFSFQTTISLLAYAATFSGQFYFQNSYFFTLLQSYYFDTTVSFFERLFFSVQLLCFRSTFFRTVTSLQQLFFQNSYFFRAKLLLYRHFFRAGSFLGQLLFRTAAFLAEELFRIYLQKSYQTATSAEQQLFQKSYILEKINFSQKQYPALTTFSGELPF